MVLFKERKVAFLLPPKTGSTTVYRFLKHSKDAIYLWDKHIKPKYALQSEPSLHEYTVYSFLRNPAERFISGLVMFKEHSFASNLLRALERDDVVDYKDFIEINYTRVRHKYHGDLLLPQAKYFNGGLSVTALDFDNYDAELRRATQSLGLDDVEIGWENEGVHDGKKEMAKKITSFIKTEYAEDCALWQERLGKVLC